MNTFKAPVRANLRQICVYLQLRNNVVTKTDFYAGNNTRRRNGPPPRGFDGRQH